jgi:hypothetical protein
LQQRVAKVELLIVCSGKVQFKRHIYGRKRAD